MASGSLKDAIHSKYFDVPRSRTGNLVFKVSEYLDAICLADDGVADLNLSSTVAFSLIDLYFLLLLPFPIISCFPGISLHVGY